MYTIEEFDKGKTKILKYILYNLAPDLRRASYAG